MDEKQKLVEFYHGRLQAVRRAHKHYLAWLLASLGFVWVSYWGKPGGAPASLFGIPITDRSLLGVTPGLSTILLLGLVGSLRALQPALEQFQEAWKKVGGTTELDGEAIDEHQNWIDYLKFIWATPFGRLVQAVVFLATVASTLAVGLILTPKFKGYTAFLFTSYCLVCLVAQAAAGWKWFADKSAAPHRKD